jgi:hypothetical protein
MAEQYSTLKDALDNQQAVFDQVHANSSYGSVSSYDLKRYNEMLEAQHSRQADTYPVQHGLTDSEMRILHKILAKDLPDCGRKRGAILRYIKAYQTEQSNHGINLYRSLAS